MIYAQDYFWPEIDRISTINIRKSRALESAGVASIGDGFVESLNNKLKGLNRRCYDIFNLERLVQLIFLDRAGYCLFA